ncbi:MAG: DUF1273 family protein, partial [Clostridia bacterium]|nr:DUF1273 family protein [Clostridia bacterium]
YYLEMRYRALIKTCCFSGHRPHKLGCPENVVKELLRTQIQKAISDGCSTFITGMAPGVDLWAGEIVIEEKKASSDIKLICAIPYPEFCGKNLFGGTASIECFQALMRLYMFVPNIKETVMNFAICGWSIIRTN